MIGRASARPGLVEAVCHRHRVNAPQLADRDESTVELSFVHDVPYPKPFELVRRPSDARLLTVRCDVYPWTGNGAGR